MKIQTRRITLAATLTALCAVTGFLPYVFFLPVAVAATSLSVGMAAFVGLAFGCVSLAYSFVMPVSLVSMAFVQAPYIAIVPRILAALGSFGMCALLTKLAKPEKRAARFAVISASAATGSLLNTALVVGLLVLVMPSMELGGVTMIAYVPTMLISGAIECVAMAVLVPPITLTLKKNVLERREKRSVTDISPSARSVSGDEANAPIAETVDGSADLNLTVDNGNAVSVGGDITDETNAESYGAQGQQTVGRSGKI